ncbi:BTB/POZ domain-containing protein At1g67900 [Oryza brachyantha]|uniref:BTB/POZ domain-containing protein At1g67900 n=1 Tax=Oryza brachyantha TaxID=4533 RepID=UPI001ADAA0DC|nr:BTB/POZ domain-containing protein At1g67900 [Oryza brachyantha]
MKFMKLGTRPDTFFSNESVRSVCTEVATDLQILVGDCLYQLHKFPLLSKCLLLQALCAESGCGGNGGEVIELPGFPGGVEAFDACAKFCYGITVTVSARNLVPLRCAAAHLGMSEAADRGNLAAKLDAFLASCLLRRWKDALAVLNSTRHYAPLCEDIGLTSRCVDAVAALISNPAALPAHSTSASPWWAHDVAELGVDLFWRIMVAVKATGAVHEKTVGDALKAYARRWLPNVAKDGIISADQPFDGASGNADDGNASVKQIATRHRLLLEKIVSLIPAERDAVSCSFLLKLLKAANILSASATSKAELVRRVAWQLEEATVGDLLIPSLSCVSETLYDVDAVAAILDEFALRHAAATAAAAPPPGPALSPDDSPARSGGHRRSRSAESVGFDGARRSSSAAPVSPDALVRVGRLVDGFLIEVARDPNMPLDKLLSIAEAVADTGRPEHDGLYKVVDTYLKVHPEMSKNARKRLCRVINCRKLSDKACAHAAQNELLPLRVVVQVLFFEHARAAALAGGHAAATELPSNIRALLQSKSGSEADDDAVDRVDEQRLRALAAGASPGDDWSVEGLRRAASKIATLRMKLEEDDHDGADDDEFVRKQAAGLARSASLRFRAFCAIPAGKPKRMLSKLWPLARGVTTERH